jgi:hypothetical protein
MPTGLDPNFERALEKVQDDVDFYSLLSAMGKPLTDGSGNPLYWSDNRIHNLSANNFLGIKFAGGYEPAGQNLVYSGTLTSDQIADVNAGKPIEMASSSGDSVLQIDTKTGAVSSTPAPEKEAVQHPETNLVGQAPGLRRALSPPAINTPHTYLDDLFHLGTTKAASRMKA